jgi:hypothetical protein
MKSLPCVFEHGARQTHIKFNSCVCINGKFKFSQMRYSKSDEVYIVVKNILQLVFLLSYLLKFNACLFKLSSYC